MNTEFDLQPRFLHLVITAAVNREFSSLDVLSSFVVGSEAAGHKLLSGPLEKRADYGESV